MPRREPQGCSPLLGLCVCLVFIAGVVALIVGISLSVSSTSSTSSFNHGINHNGHQTHNNNPSSHTTKSLFDDQEGGCTFTQGYWKNFPSQWPSVPFLGSVVYTKEELLSIFKHSTKGNGLVILAHQLLAAKLNRDNGADSNAIDDEIAEADALIGDKVVPPVNDSSDYIKPKDVNSLVKSLDHYNKGIIGPGHCDEICHNVTCPGNDTCPCVPCPPPQVNVSCPPPIVNVSCPPPLVNVTCPDCNFSCPDCNPQINVSCPEFNLSHPNISFACNFDPPSSPRNLNATKCCETLVTWDAPIIDSDEAPIQSYTTTIIYEDETTISKTVDAETFEVLFTKADGLVGGNVTVKVVATNHFGDSEPVYTNTTIKFAGWNLQVVDSQGTVGEYTSLLIKDGRPAISYYDGTNFDLKYAEFDGIDWNIAMVDSVGFVGRYTSLALVGAYPAISYHAFVGGGRSDLKYAEFNGTDWNNEIVDDIGQSGTYTSLEVIGGYPGISYREIGGGDLKYAQFNGTLWNTEIVDNVGTVGEYTSLTNINEYPAISYFDDTNSALKYAQFNGTTWNIETVDATGNVGRSTSLITIGGYPAISYGDRGNGALKFAQFNGTNWNLETVDNTSDTGTTSLALIGGYPAISYLSSSPRDLKYAQFNGDTWDIVTVDDINAVGAYNSLTDIGGYPAISYYYSTGRDLKYAQFCPTFEPQTTPCPCNFSCPDCNPQINVSCPEVNVSCPLLESTITTSTTSTIPEWACCRFDGSCVDKPDEQTCEREGQGTWNEGVTCASNPCEGSCCKNDSTCANTTQFSCQFDLGGVFHPDTSCNENPCGYSTTTSTTPVFTSSSITTSTIEEEEGACCIPGRPEAEQCEQSFTACMNAGAAWVPGASCNDADENGVADLCEVGACCHANGTECFRLRGYDCLLRWQDSTFYPGRTCIDLGACCHDDNTICTMLFLRDCCKINGTFHWDENCTDPEFGCEVTTSTIESTTITTSTTSTILVWACCRFDGSCVDKPDEQTCEREGQGTWNEGVTCASNPCEGSCCKNDSTCANTTQFSCQFDLGGVFHPDTSCNENPCGYSTTTSTTSTIPEWACCISDGSCVDEPDAGTCGLKSGAWNEGVTCASNPCQGICCNTDNTCDNTTQLFCNISGGVFHSGASCNENPCGYSTTLTTTTTEFDDICAPIDNCTGAPAQTQNECDALIEVCDDRDLCTNDQCFKELIQGECTCFHERPPVPTCNCVYNAIENTCQGDCNDATRICIQDASVQGLCHCFHRDCVETSSSSSSSSFTTSTTAVFDDNICVPIDNCTGAPAQTQNECDALIEVCDDRDWCTNDICNKPFIRGECDCIHEPVPACNCVFNSTRGICEGDCLDPSQVCITEGQTCKCILRQCANLIDTRPE